VGKIVSPRGQSSLRYIMKTKDNLFVPKRAFYQIVKEEVANYGIPNINTKELIALLIGFPANMEVCYELANLSSDRFASLTEAELRSVYRLPKAAAQRLVIAISLAKKINMSKKKEKVISPIDAAQALSFIKNEEQEHFVVLLLDTKNNIKNKHIVSKGTANSSLANPRELFKFAIRENAIAAIVGHNHPSGDPEPSRDDIDVTQRLIKAGELIGITILDHIIVAGERYASLTERGLI